MPAAIDATVGGSASNSYVSVAESTTYLEERLNVTAWEDALPDDHIRALIAATRRIDQERFEGVPVNPLTGTSTGTTQTLKWPRYSADDDAGWTWEATVIPQPVKHATIELALYLLNQGTTDPAQPTGLEGFENVKVGALDITPRIGFVPDELPGNVLRLLAPVLVTTRHTGRLMRA
jgi:hypothetical protein